MCAEEPWDSQPVYFYFSPQSYTLCISGRLKYVRLWLLKHYNIIMTFIKCLLMSWEIIQILEIGKRDFWVSPQWSTRHYLRACPTWGLSDLLDNVYIWFPISYFWLAILHIMISRRQVVIIEAYFTEEEMEILERWPSQGHEEGTRTQTQICLPVSHALDHYTTQ